MRNRNKSYSFSLVLVILFIAFGLSPVFGTILTIISLFFFIKNPQVLISSFPKYAETLSTLHEYLVKDSVSFPKKSKGNQVAITGAVSNLLSKKIHLDKRKKYLHIALNNTLEEAQEIISRLPISDRILIEVGTPLIKIYGTEAISQIKAMAPVGTYIVADNKCADLAAREVIMMASAGAHASTCLGVAPVETIDSFIEECRKFKIDSIIDMMNVENAFLILKKLKKMPTIVMLHRGVDESELSDKQIPFYQIKQIKGNYDVLVAVAGADDIREVQRAIFNDADIVVIWKNFYHSNDDTAELAESFLKEIE